MHRNGVVKFVSSAIIHGEMNTSPITTHTLWMLLKEAPDVPGEWLAICPKLGMITQGTGPKHAAHMGVEAIEMLWTHDIRAGKDPFAREDPEDPFTTEILEILSEHELVVGPVGPALEQFANLRVAVVQVNVWAQTLHLNWSNAVGAKDTELYSLAS